MRNTFTSACLILLIIITASCSRKGMVVKAHVSLNKAWATDNILRTPESALYDQSKDIIYVSNINKMSGLQNDGDGFISKVKPTGEIEDLYWVSGLNDPKGMAIHNNVLYVADVNEIVAISTQTGAVIDRYTAERARFLNDVAVDNTGRIYVTDSDQKRIYQLYNGKVSTWIESTEREKPNGIFIDENRMLIAFMSTGDVKALDPETQQWTNWAEGIKSADGIIKFSDDEYLISSWDGEVYYLNSNGKKWKVLDTKENGVNAADIGYAEKPGLVLVPTFKDNRLVAYTISRR